MVHYNPQGECSELVNFSIHAVGSDPCVSELGNN